MMINDRIQNEDERDLALLPTRPTDWLPSAVGVASWGRLALPRSARILPRRKVLAPVRDLMDAREEAIRGAVVERFAWFALAAAAGALMVMSFY